MTPTYVACDAGTFAEAVRAPWTSLLQRVVVRMLFDPKFKDQVYDDPVRALDGLDFPPRLVQQLRENDRRLWTADRLRRPRALKTLMAEYKCSTALVLDATRSLRTLYEFFSSPEFHNTIQSRGYLALAFGAWMESQVRLTPQIHESAPSVLALEATAALARRELREQRRGRPARVGDERRPDQYRLRPGYRAVIVPSGTLVCIQAVEAWFFEAGLIPAASLCTDGPTLSRVPGLGRARSEAYLTEPTENGDVVFAEIPLSFAELGIHLHQSGDLQDFVTRCGGQDTDALAHRLLELHASGVLEFG